jgi:hypothetical protein
MSTTVSDSGGIDFSTSSFIRLKKCGFNISLSLSTYPADYNVPYSRINLSNELNFSVSI